jgi:hypothetical protein
MIATIALYQFWLIDSLLRHNPITSIYRNEEEAEAANGGDNASHPGQDYFRDSRPSEAASGGDVERNGNPINSWWKNRNDNRKQGGESQNHLIGDVSDDEEEGTSDGTYSYPPPRSASSSVAQLDRTARLSNGENAENTATLLHDATLDTPPMQPRADKAATLLESTPLDRESSRERRSNDSVREEEDDAWDNWDEDKAKTPTAQKGKKLD